MAEQRMVEWQRLCSADCAGGGRFLLAVAVEPNAGGDDPNCGCVGSNIATSLATLVATHGPHAGILSLAAWMAWEFRTAVGNDVPLFIGQALTLPWSS